MNTGKLLNEIIIDSNGNATVIGERAHLLWNYCKGEFPRTKCSANNFYVMEYREFPQGFRWDIVAAQTTELGSRNYLSDSRVRVDVTNAPRS